MRVLSWLICLGMVVAAHGQNKQYVIDPSTSTFSFEVEHFGVATVKGSFSDTQGTIWYNASSPDSLVAQITIGVASINTDNKLRDKELRSEDFLDVDRYPTVSFSSGKKGVRRTASGLMIKGNMKIYGTTQSIEVPFSATHHTSSETMTITTDFTLKRSDYGLSFGILMDALVGEEIKVRVQATARLING